MIEKMRTVVHLAEDEVVLVVKKNAYYKLGYPVEDIVHGVVIADAQRVEWCSVAQEWIV